MLPCPLVFTKHNRLVGRPDVHLIEEDHAIYGTEYYAGVKPKTGEPYTISINPEKSNEGQIIGVIPISDMESIWKARNYFSSMVTNTLYG